MAAGHRFVDKPERNAQRLVAKVAVTRVAAMAVPVVSLMVANLLAAQLVATPALVGMLPSCVCRLRATSNH